MEFTLPEPIFRKAERLAQDQGFASVSDYVSELVQRDESSPFEGREVEVQAALVAGLESGPTTSMTHADWDQLKRRVREKHAKGAAVLAD